MIGAWLKKLRKPKSRNRPRPERKAKAVNSFNFARWLPTMSGVAIAAMAFAFAAYALDRPIHKVEVAGVFRRVTAMDVEKIVRGHLHGGFVRANLGEVQGAIEALPWVDTARVQRHWPDALVVHITEQEAIARWGDSGLVNARGELFVRDERHVPMELPLLKGPDGTERRVADRFFQIRSQLESAGLVIQALSLDDRGAWEIELSSGVVVRLGRREIEERMERFLNSGVAILSNKASEISYIDMRYSNGFAVGWHSSHS